MLFGLCYLGYASAPLMAIRGDITHIISCCLRKWTCTCPQGWKVSSGIAFNPLIVSREDYYLIHLTVAKMTCKADCNSLIFHAFFNKQLEACRSLISTLETKYPESDFPCLMRASLLHREKHSDKAVELLKVRVILFIKL